MEPSTLSVIALKEKRRQRAMSAKSAMFLGTLFATVQPGMQWVTPVDVNRERDMFVGLVEVSFTTSRTAQYQTSRAPVLVGSEVGRHKPGKLHRTNVGFAYQTQIWRQIIPTHAVSKENDISSVPGGGHVLIVPIAHQPTYTSIPPDIAPPIMEETEKYKSALRKFYANYGGTAVFFEVGRLSSKGGHAHIQAVPIPNRLRYKVEEAFVREGRDQGIEFEANAEEALEACSGGHRSYFRVDLPDGRKMIHLLNSHVSFSVQFGRQVLANLLSIPERLDWKACMLDEEGDRADVESFKKAFSAFDLSL
ncbi:hypothetical protein ID866_7936 [Astraeus odoratus]|nr:hypothetical protein ID866_7936 [Astraeus odoratus]